MPGRAQNANGLPDYWEDGVLTTDEIGRSPQAKIYLSQLSRNIARQRGLPSAQVGACKKLAVVSFR
jgi:hypothetical protein